MKSCLSLIISLAIIVIFAVTATVLWYGSSTTKISAGEDFQPANNITTEENAKSE